MLYRRLAEAEEVANGSKKSMRAMAAELYEEYGSDPGEGLEREREEEIRRILMPITSALKEEYDPEIGDHAWIVPREARSTISEVRSIAMVKCDQSAVMKMNFWQNLKTRIERRMICVGPCDF